MKINISQEAVDMLKEFKKDRDGYLRVFIDGYGWGGPNFKIALDEQKEGDEVVSAGGVDFLLDEDMTAADGLEIDVMNSFFGKRLSIRFM